MNYVLAAFAAVILIGMVWGVATGRLKASNCCSVADPSKDLRMRAAFEEPIE